MRFDRNYHGPQGFSSDDTYEAGANYAQVLDAVFSNPYYLTWGAKGEPALPVYEVTAARLLRGFLPGGRMWQFKSAAARSVASKSLLRWGKNGKGFRRLLHPNSVCLFGVWKVDQETEYSGYFRPNSEALVIARYSTCCTECRRGHFRSLSLAGVLFPTTEPDHKGDLPTASFFTQEDIGGAKTDTINEAVLRNAPDVSPWRRGFGLPGLLLTGLAFQLVDREPTQRQLYEIAELGKPKDIPTCAPKFMQLTVSEDQPTFSDGTEDFRDEVMRHIYDPGDPTARRSLKFDIQVTDQSRSLGRLVVRRSYENWKRIGQIEFAQAVTSYNGDFVLHIPHPKWRSDL